MHAGLKAVQHLLFNKPNGFSACHRIHISQGFTVCLNSKSIGNQYYKLFFTSNQKSYARLGIIASKKCMHKAVDRNTNKRAIREVFRTHSIGSKSLDLVVLIRLTKTESFADQRVELVNLFSRLEELCAIS